jgi:threonine dehydrogenase-like Zn-dependent dehydrogenase
MRALVLSDQLRYTDHPLPTLAEGEALLRVLKAGVCNTDLELIKGYMGFKGVLGHEFVGVLEDWMPSRWVEPRAGVEPGARVVGEINCVACDSPSRTWFARAQDAGRTTVGIFQHDGAFAEYVRLPIANLHKVPDGVSDEEAVFVEPLAAACQILEQVHLKPTDKVSVVGDGKLGLLCAQVIATTGCNLTAWGKHPNKLNILARRGIRTNLVSQWDSSRTADVVIECTGSEGGFETSRQMLRPRGILVQKSTYAGIPQANLTMLVVDEQTLIGSRCGPFEAALRLLEKKQVEVLSLIHARYGLKDGVEALQKAQERGVLKVLLDIA